MSNPNPVESERDTLILIGQQIEAFLELEAGQYIVASIEQDIAEAKDNLLELNPYEYDSLPKLQSAIAGLQSKALRKMDLKQYFADTITTGRNAAIEPAPEDSAGT